MVRPEYLKHVVAVPITMQAWSGNPPRPRTRRQQVMGLFRVNRGAAVWCWMALAVIGGCRPTVLGGVDSRGF